MFNCQTVISLSIVVQILFVVKGVFPNDLEHYYATESAV